MRGIHRIPQVAPILFVLLSLPRTSSAVEFAPAKNYPVGRNAKAMVVADFNNDGKLDIAVANVDSNNVSILLGNGDGTFQATKNFDAGGNSLAAADFNGDGKLDLVVGMPANPQLPGCEGSSVSILLGNGDGTFQPPRQAVTLSSKEIVVAVGDFNADNRSDLVVKRFDYCPARGFSVFAGNGDGTFQSEKALSDPPDFNGDGIPDYAEADSFTGEFKIWLGKGNGTYERLLPGATSPAGRQIFADVNADQKQDKVFVQRRFPNPTTWVATAIGNGDGTFQPAQIYPPGGYSCTPRGACFAINELCVADFNGDGKPDVAVINAGMQGFRIFLGRGDGTLSGPFDFDTGSGPLTFAIADLNGDHLPDLILGNIDDGTISVVLNTTPASGADLSVLLSATPEPVSVTQNLTYTVQAINAGPQDATNLTLKTTLPPGMNFVSATSEQGNCAQASLVVTCTASKLVSGGSMVATIIVVPTATGSASSSASVSAAEADPSLGDDSASHSTRVDPMFKLQVTKAGNGSGTVASNGSNVINCGTTCTASLATGTRLDLIPNPDGGSGFGGWSGACNGASGGCDLIMNVDQTTTATFDPLPNFALSADATALTVKRGSSVTTNISVFPEGNSFDSAVALSCSFAGPAPMPTCTFAPASVTPGSITSYSMLTITAPTTTATLIPPFRAKQLTSLYAMGVPLGLVGCVLAADFHEKRRRLLALCLLMLVAVILPAACGGGSEPVKDRMISQNYMATVEATSGTISKTVQIQVTVQ